MHKRRSLPLLCYDKHPQTADTLSQETHDNNSTITSLGTPVVVFLSVLFANAHVPGLFANAHPFVDVDSGLLVSRIVGVVLWLSPSPLVPEELQGQLVEALLAVASDEGGDPLLQHRRDSATLPPLPSRDLLVESGEPRETPADG